MTAISLQTETEIRSLVALAGRVLSANGHSDYIWGHVAVRDPHGRGFWIKASGQGFEEVTPDSVLLVGPDGEVLAGEGRCHVEWPIHASILAARRDVGAVVHTHPPHAIGMAAADQPLRPLSHAGTLFTPPDVPRFTKTANLIVTPELGNAVASTLGVQHAAFLVNHGIVTAGADVRSAVIRAVLLEDACRQQSVCGSFGGPAVWPDNEESLAKRRTVWSEAHLGQLWEYLARQLDRVPA
jgi:ribulose-5-phosphate 4-epimerase/fuculose-1-phosphate aldolase